MYARGQRWQDGCQFNCVCENEVTGEYRCTDRSVSGQSLSSSCVCRCIYLKNFTVLQHLRGTLLQHLVCQYAADV